MKKSIFLFFAAILCAMSAQGATYLPGSWNNWNASGNKFSGNPALSKIELNANTAYTFKVKDGDSWLGNNGTINNDIENWTFSTSGGDCKLNTNKKGVYVFKWSSNKLSVIYPHIYTVAGSSTELLGTSWDPSNTNNNLQTDDYVTYKLVKHNVPLTKGDDISFKITVDNSWDKSYPSDNQTFNIPNTGLYNVTFTFNVLTKDVSVTTTEVKRYITGNANLVGANEWKADAQPMTYAAANNGTFSHTFNLAAETIYDLKITDGSWDNHWGHSNLKTKPEHVSTFGDNNISFYLSQPGNVTVTFDAIAGKIELTGNFAKIVPTINLLGLNNNWETTAENKMISKSEDVVSCKATLAAGTNQFKIYIKEFDKWYGNSAAIIRDNALVNKVLSDGESDISIQADVDGEYEFIWNYETKELSVVYPNTTVEYDKIYFVNSDGWSKVYAHLWLENSEPVINNVAWPGADITANKEGTVNGYDIHYVTFIKGAYDKCIFNGGGDDKKTNNLAIMDDYKYFYQVTGSWYANLEDIEASTNKFVLGEFNNYAKEKGEFLKVDENLYSITIHMNAGTYKFKVVDDAWLGNNGKMERGGTSVATGGWTFEGEKDDCQIVADTEGDYVFTWYSNTKKLTVTYPALIYTRTVTSGDYGTICLPYNVKNYTGAIFYEIAGKEGNKVIFDEVSELEAGQPYIFMAETDEIILEQDNKKADLAGKHMSLQGTFTQIDPAVDNILVGNYMLVNNIIKMCGINCGLYANRAYFVADDLENMDKAPAAAPGRRRISLNVTSENTTTGLDNITNGENTTIKVIENGQLIIIRNGEKFNAQGVRLE